jgi:hypothetical protein
LLLQRFGGLGAMPGAQTLVEDWMPATVYALECAMDELAVALTRERPDT